MTYLPFAAAITLIIALPSVCLAQNFNPMWGIPSGDLSASRDKAALLVPATNAPPRANFFSGVAGYGPQLSAAPTPSAETQKTIGD